jgi:hypothetical protein
VERLGGALCRVPLLGPRAAKKQAEAREVREAIASVAARPPVEGVYPGAAAAVAAALGPTVG